MATVIALFETTQGETVGVRFPNAAAAVNWEIEHEAEILSVGRVRIVTKSEALRLADQS